MKLEVDVTRNLGAFRLDARLDCEDGLLALFGRSGAGKTSLINTIAGLLRPDRGRIAVGGEVLFDSKSRIDVPKHRRRVGYVFQEPRLFPHLSVRRNLLYGRRFCPAAERYVELDRVLELLGLGVLLERRPGLLSGGEKQRVAIGRALLASPRILLMDEPLASLDAERKEEIFPYIERLRYESRVPIVYVSHAIAEVTRLATTVALMADGRITACGPVGEIMSRPDPRGPGRHEAGAVFDALVTGHDEAFALTHLNFAGGELRVPLLDMPKGSAIRVRIRARDVIVSILPPAGLSTLNIFRGEIMQLVEGDGTSAELRIGLGDAFLLASVTRKSVADLQLEPGRDVFALVKSVAFDDRSEDGRRALPRAPEADS
ncbi:MAG: molybdenum ABC transporter ATP-binding protein [Gammaproteobacteria bacterium]|nr:molybdenum ABC transporter ATP-binding protein [Gammaproteobacteria bacterium]